jgi:hypothetical protein
VRTPVLIYRIDTGFAATWYTESGPIDWTIGLFVHIIIDDITDVVSIELHSGTDPDTGLLGGGPIISGPDLYFNASVGTFITGYGGVATIITPQPYYQRCDLTTLVKFSPVGNFPYGAMSYIPGAAECQYTPVCDLEFSSIYTVVRPTTAVSTDGQIHVTATTSNGVPKFALNADFDYNTEGQLTGDFTGLASGLYTVYAKDPIGCLDNILINLEFKPEYGIKYRMEFDDLLEESQKHHRVDILERGYEGELEEIYEGATPILLRYNGNANDPNIVIYPAEITLTLMSETPGKFAELFGPDDRKFKVIYYVDNDPQPFFIGFILNEFYTEPYIHEPFEVSVTATCGLGEMKNYDFVDDSGNKFKGNLRVMKIMADIFKLTGLQLPIRSTINVFDEGMDKNESGNIQFLPPLNDPGWTNQGSGDDWILDGAEIYTTLTTGSSKEYTYNLPISSQPGAYSYMINRQSSGFAPGDSLNLHYNFYDEFGVLLGNPTTTEFVSFDFNISYPYGATAPVRVAKVGIVAEVNSGTGMTMRIHDFPLTGPAVVFSEDPFDQLYVDSRIYLDSKGTPTTCDKVLQSFADTIRGEIFQSMGYWWIVRKSDRVRTINFRQFDYNGNYESYGTLDPLLELKYPSDTNRLAWRDKSQVLSFLRNYGKFTITQNLGKDGNLIDEGRFEEDDLVDLGSGNKMFKNWNFIINQPGITYGLQKVDNGESTGAFFADYTRATGLQNDSKLYSVEVPFEGGAPDQIRIKFQYQVLPTNNVPWIRISWELKITSDDGLTSIYFINYNDDPGFNKWESTPYKNEIYVTDYGSFQTLDVTALASNNGAPIGSGKIQISFYMHNHNGRDFEDITDLKTFDLDAYLEPQGLQRLVAEDSDSNTYYYKSEYSTEAEDLPNIVRPNTFSGAGYLWKLDKIVNIGAFTGLVQRFLIDNVSIAYLPWTSQGVNLDPSETLTFEHEVSKLIKSTFEKEIILGDIVNIPNAANLYRGYFRLEDGTPTNKWARDGVAEEKYLGELLLDDYVGQFSDPAKALSGRMISDVVYHFIHCIRNNIDLSRYIAMTYEFDAKQASYQVDLIRIIAGEDGEPVASGEFHEDEFSDDFNTGS